MSFSAKIWIGADPGGTGNFGLAILKSDGSAHTCCVNCADEAIDVVKERVKIQPAGVGVDSPLWWSSVKGVNGVKSLFLTLLEMLASSTKKLAPSDFRFQFSN
jgi:hypothetical protein